MRKINTGKSVKATIVATLALALIAAPFSLRGDIARAETMMPGYNGKIVFGSYISGNNQIYTMDSDGSNLTRLTNHALNDSGPRWSPDGSLIAFRSLRDGDLEIYVMNADGTNQRRLTNAAGSELSMVWSPDSSKLAYAATRAGNADIYMYDLTVSTEIRLTTSAAADNGPDWSPDGSKIAYRSDFSGNRDVVVIDVNELTTTRLTTATGSDYLPHWSPDGTKLLFQSLRHGPDVELYTINSDGSNETRLTNTPGFDEIIEDPWSPNGQYFAIVKYNSAWTASTIEVMAADGEVHKVIDLNSEGLGYPERVTWSPDSKELLITAYEDSNMNAPFFLKYSLESEEIQYMADDEASGYGHWLAAPNSAPNTTTDTATFTYNTAGTVDILANDNDEEALLGDNLTIATAPLNGAAFVENGKIKYIPSKGFVGADLLTYQICDAFILDQKCSTDTVYITVQQPTAPALAVTKVNGENFSSETNSYATSNLRPTISGTASPGAEVIVEIHSDPVVLTTATDESGNWSVAPTIDLPNGEHTVYISATQYGLTTELGSFRLTVQPSLAETGTSLGWIVVGGLNMIGGGLGWLFFNYRRVRVP